MAKAACHALSSGAVCSRFTATKTSAPAVYSQRSRIPSQKLTRSPACSFRDVPLCRIHLVCSAMPTPRIQSSCLTTWQVQKHDRTGPQRGVVYTHTHTHTHSRKALATSQRFPPSDAPMVVRTTAASPQAMSALQPVEAINPLHIHSPSIGCSQRLHHSCAFNAWHSRDTLPASRNAATPSPQVGTSPPQPLGEGIPLARCHQVCLYQSALGGCAPDYVNAVIASCWRPLLTLIPRLLPPRVV